MQWCLDYLKYWMNAIYVHCNLKDKNNADVERKPPPVLLIGTRKDKIKSPQVHKQISQLSPTRPTHYDMEETVNYFKP